MLEIYILSLSMMLSFDFGNVVDSVVFIVFFYFISSILTYHRI